MSKIAPTQCLRGSWYLSKIRIWGVFYSENLLFALLSFYQRPCETKLSLIVRQVFPTEIRRCTWVQLILSKERTSQRIVEDVALKTQCFQCNPKGVRHSVTTHLLNFICVDDLLFCMWVKKYELNDEESSSVSNLLCQVQRWQVPVCLLRIKIVS